MDKLTTESLRGVLSRIWTLGQMYWQQADSEYASQNRKSDETRKTYLAMVEETCAALPAIGNTARIYQIGSPTSSGTVWWDVDRERYEREKKAGYMKTGIVYRVQP